MSCLFSTDWKDEHQILCLLYISTLLIGMASFSLDKERHAGLWSETISIILVSLERFNNKKKSKHQFQSVNISGNQIYTE